MRSRPPLRLTARRGLRPSPSWPPAGTVVTGAIDPLREIAEIAHKGRAVAARRRRLWRTGGAGGAGEVPGIGFGRLSCRSMRTNGFISRSIAAACSTAIRQVARTTFSHGADYVKSVSEDPVGSPSRFFEESMELSRRFRALKLWMSLQYHGRRAYRAAIAQRSAPCPAAGAGDQSHTGSGTAGASPAQRRVLPSPRQG